MRPSRQLLSVFALGALNVAWPSAASAQEEAEAAPEHPATIVERPPILPLGTWRTTLEMSAVGATEEQTGAIGVSTSLFPGVETGLALITQLGNRETETGAKIRARLIKSLIEGSRVAVVGTLFGKYDYDAREWGGIGIGLQAQGRIGSLLFFLGGDDISGDFDQASARLSLPIGVGLQLTPRVYIDASAMLDASYDSSVGSGGDFSPLAASTQISLNDSLDLIISADASKDHGFDPSEALWLVSARYQGTL